MYEEKTILTIDDNVDVQQGVQVALADRPCRFVFVDKAEDAVMSLMVEAPDIVIVSMELPGGEGVSMLDNMRTMNPDVPMIVLIGQPDKDKVIAAKKAGAIDILLKPPNWERLSNKVKNALWLREELLAQPQPAPGQEGAAAPNGQPAPPPPPEEEPKPEFVEAVPKGAEVLNINDTIAGMKVARTLVLNGVVYADKGQILKEETIKQLNRIGASELCVYISPELKKRVEERKKRLLQQQSAVAAAKSTDASGAAVFSKVKRQTLRVATDIIGVFTSKDEQGEDYEAQCNIVDVSAGGCALLTAERLRKDQSIFMTFDLGGMEMKKLRGVVRHSIARNAKPPEFPMRSGIFFDGITEKDKERLFNKVFALERENKQKEDELRARYGYGPKKRRLTT